MKILVVDDESSISTAVAYALRREGFEVETAQDGLEALELVGTFNPDVMVLDVMMPRMGGYEVCRKLEGRSRRPAILLLTVKNDIVDKVLGLELGADDYMTKPFDIRELIARVKVLGRRGNRQDVEHRDETREIVRLGQLTGELFSRVIRLQDQQLELTPKEFDLLILLMRNPERVYSREALLEQVWDMDFAGGTRTVDIHIQRLRRKLGDYHGVIQTVYGIGYKSTGNM
jgi:two-component system alkaline phosphatase synthesis response regulator PhoP